jgi:hypothetical protein
LQRLCPADTYDHWGRGFETASPLLDDDFPLSAGRGSFMFNAPGAIHGGISCDLTLYIHCCSGEPDEIVSIDLIDFAPAPEG